MSSADNLRNGTVDNNKLRRFPRGSLDAFRLRNETRGELKQHPFKYPYLSLRMRNGICSYQMYHQQESSQADPVELRAISCPPIHPTQMLVASPARSRRSSKTFSPSPDSILEKRRKVFLDGKHRRSMKGCAVLCPCMVVTVFNPSHRTITEIKLDADDDEERR
eukprot:754037-Hanusia_phi.AAC.7